MTLHVVLHIPTEGVTVVPLSADADPLVAPSPREIPLKDSPLVRVIAQVRFPQILSIRQPEFVAPFQEALRAKYPVGREEQTRAVLVGPGGIAPAKSQTAWRV